VKTKTLVVGLLLLLPILANIAYAQIERETPGVTTLGEPLDSWFLIKSDNGTYIFDGDTGEMQGLISNQFYTPAVITLLSRDEAYLVESFYSRGVRGKREDVLTVIDMDDLSPKAEIDIPDKAAALPHRGHIGLLGDERHIVVFNMTPAQSVSIVDVVDREFDGEISTPGCAIILPTGQSAFLMICGDGSLQYMELDGNGKEIRRERTEPFFMVEKDPVFGIPIKTADGWLLVSHEGLAYEVSVNGSQVEVAEPWDLLSQQDRQDSWRAGGSQPFTVHRNSTLLYVLMHQGGIDTHSEPGTVIRVYDLERKNHVGSMALGTAATHILSSQEEDPKLYVYDLDGKLGIYDGHKLRPIRTIDEPGRGAGFGLLQALAPND
jgi:methylamine dehydrogenase heavy chain